MNARTMLRSAAAAAAIGVMVLASPAGHALAAPKDAEQKCTAGGGVSGAGKQACANKRCRDDRKYGGATHGDERVEGRYPALRTVYRCGGFTGQWVKVRTSGDGVPSLPEHTFDQAP